jgi:hypothetical protein
MEIALKERHWKIMKIMIDTIGDYWRFEKKIGQNKL